MDMNENAWGPSPGVEGALEQTINASHYPDYGGLLEALSVHFQLSREHILLTAGANEALRCCLATFLEMGEEAILPVPTYSVIPLLVEQQGGTPVPVPFCDDLSLPLKNILGAVQEHTGAIILVHPGSPTGGLIEEEEVRSILEANPHIPVLLDETYYHYAGFSHYKLIQEYPQLLIVHTFSKAHGLAGLRVGYILSQPQNIKEIHKMNTTYPINIQGVEGAIAALHDEEHLEKVVEETAREKQFLKEELEKRGGEVLPTHTNFFLASLPGDKDALVHRLSSLGILIRTPDPHPLIEAYLRITIGRHEDNLRFLKALDLLMHPPEALLLDMDGVLVDVGQSYHEAILATAHSFGAQAVNRKDIQAKKLAGGYNNDWDLTLSLLKERGYHPCRQAVVRFFQEAYLGSSFNGFIERETWLLPETILASLARQFSLGIVTGRPREEALHALERSNTLPYFSVLITEDDVEPGKPHPKGLLKAMAHLGTEKALYVGDTVDDMKAAQRAGIMGLGVLAPGALPHTTAQALLKAGALGILERTADLKEVFPCETQQ